VRTLTNLYFGDEDEFHRDLINTEGDSESDVIDSGLLMLDAIGRMQIRVFGKSQGLKIEYTEENRAETARLIIVLLRELAYQDSDIKVTWKMPT